MSKTLFTLTLLTSAALASAQSISSFSYADIVGVNVVRTGNNIDLSVSATPTLTFNNVTYTITDVFGVWALDDNDDMTASVSAQNGWSASTNFSGTGGIAGWKTNPNSGLTPGQNLSFSYTSLNGTVEDFGYHIRVSGNLPGGGNTAYFRQEPVPEPATLSAVALGLGALLRRRKAR